MRTVEVKLADWHRLYKELAEAQSRLAQQSALPPRDQNRAGLEAEVARLQRDCDAALDIVQTLIHGRKAMDARESRQPAA